MNLIRMNRVYSSLCNSYLVKSRPKRTVDMMEKVLLLMQAESLQKQIPLFHCKIFLDGSHIRIPYISDLLAVDQKAFFPPESRYFLFHQGFDEYTKMLKRLRRLDQEQINERVMKILQHHKLDADYFVYAPYHHTWMRRLARLKIEAARHWMMNDIRMILFVPLPAVLIALIKANSTAGEVHVLIHYQRKWALILIGAVTFVSALVWTFHWMRATAYERRHTDCI